MATITTNEVKFVLNDELIVLMGELQEHFRVLLLESIDHALHRAYNILLVNQSKIRDYIIENQHRITFIPKHTLRLSSDSMPELYGLCMLAVSDLSRVSSFEDITEQFMVFGEVPVFENNIDQKKDMCICSHLCLTNNLWQTKNIYNNNSLILGSVCIAKYQVSGTETIIQFKQITDDNQTIDKLMAGTATNIPNIQTATIDRYIAILEKRRAECIDKDTMSVFVDKLNIMLLGVAHTRGFKSALQIFIRNTQNTLDSLYYDYYLPDVIQWVAELKTGEYEHSCDELPFGYDKVFIKYIRCIKPYTDMKSQLDIDSLLFSQFILDLTIMRNSIINNDEIIIEINRLLEDCIQVKDKIEQKKQLILQHQLWQDNLAQRQRESTQQVRFDDELEIQSNSSKIYLIVPYQDSNKAYQLKAGYVYKNRNKRFFIRNGFNKTELLALWEVDSDQND